MNSHVEAQKRLLWVLYFLERDVSSWNCRWTFLYTDSKAWSLSSATNIPVYSTDSSLPIANLVYSGFLKGNVLEVNWMLCHKLYLSRTKPTACLKKKRALYFHLIDLLEQMPSVQNFLSYWKFYQIVWQRNNANRLQENLMIDSSPTTDRNKIVYWTESQCQNRNVKNEGRPDRPMANRGDRENHIDQEIYLWIFTTLWEVKPGRNIIMRTHISKSGSIHQLSSVSVNNLPECSSLQGMLSGTWTYGFCKTNSVYRAFKRYRSPKSRLQKSISKTAK